MPKENYPDIDASTHSRRGFTKNSKYKWYLVPKEICPKSNMKQKLELAPKEICPERNLKQLMPKEICPKELLISTAKGDLPSKSDDKKPYETSIKLNENFLTVIIWKSLCF